MAERQTEMRHARAEGFDQLPEVEALTILAQGQVAAAEAVSGAIPEIARGAALMAATIANGGRLIYAAAGSSGLMALADALELPGTYGIQREQISIMFAGGAAALTDMVGGPEDDANTARAEIAQIGVRSGDCIIAVTASGSTPYPMAAVAAAREAGAKCIGIANNAASPLFELVEVAICLPTPPEVIAGSTRMGAGTAQKIALNMMSTMMAVHLGEVHDGFMVNVVADNIKLRIRARAMIMAISGVDETAADRALEAAGGAVKLAIVLASGIADAPSAAALLKLHGGKLRPALASLGR